MTPFVVVFTFEEDSSFSFVLDADGYDEAVEAALLMLPLGDILNLTMIRAIQVDAMPEHDLPQIEYGV